MFVLSRRGCDEDIYLRAAADWPTRVPAAGGSRGLAVTL